MVLGDILVLLCHSAVGIIAFNSLLLLIVPYFNLFGTRLIVMEIFGPPRFGLLALQMLLF